MRPHGKLIIRNDRSVYDKCVVSPVYRRHIPSPPSLRALLFVVLANILELLIAALAPFANKFRAVSDM